MIRWQRSIKIFILCCADILFLLAAFFIACHLVHFSFVWEWPRKIFMLVMLVGLQISMFYFFGLYRTSLRHASIDSMLAIVKAVTVSSLLLVVGFFFINVLSFI